MVEIQTSALHRFSRAAMATRFELLFPWGSSQVHEAANAALDVIDRLESQLTVYRESSEVSRLNRLAPKAPVPVEGELYDLLCLCTRLSKETDGAFDVTAGPLIKAWGFYQRQGRIASNDEVNAALASVGMRHVKLDPARRSVRFDRPGVEINLGSIGKGYALDRAAMKLHAHGIESALLSGGASSVLALGHHAWPTGLRSPDGLHRLGTISLMNQALGVSGATYQHFEYNHRKLGHLLDPRTGCPARETALAAAVAPTAAEADALATAFYVLGLSGAAAYCQRRSDVAAVIMNDDGELHTINMAPEMWVEAKLDEHLWGTSNELPE